MNESSKLQPRFWITILVVAAALWGIYPYLLDKSLDHFGLNNPIGNPPALPGRLSKFDF